MARRAARSRASTKGEASGKLTDAGARGIGKVVKAASRKPTEVPGPSLNPATNLLIQDIAMRASGRLVRHTLEKGILRGRYGGTGAKEIVENRTLMQTLVSGMLARYATRSLPGAALIGGGLIVKTLYDRSRGKREAKKAGDRSLAKSTRK